MPATHLSALISEILDDPPTYTLDFRWDDKYGVFSILVSIVHIPRASPPEKTLDLLTPVALCDQAFEFIHGSDRPATLALPDVRTLRVLCSTVRFACAAPATNTITEVFRAPIDAALAKEKERRWKPNEFLDTVKTGVPNAFAHVPFGELSALVAVFPGLQNMVLRGVVADASDRGLRRVAAPPWCPDVDGDGDVTMESASDRQTPPLSTLDTLVIDLSLDLHAAGIWTETGIQPGLFTITEVLMPLALFAQVDRLVLRHLSHVMVWRDESTVKPIVSACSVQHLHIKGDYICRNVLQGFLQLLKSKSKVGRHLETLEVAKLYAQDMAVIREFVGSTGKHFKRLIFGLVDYQHNFLAIDKDFSFLVCPSLEELSLRVIHHPPALCPKPPRVYNACGWTLLCHALSTLSCVSRDPRCSNILHMLHTLRIEVAWHGVDARGRVYLTALDDDHLSRATRLIDQMLVGLPALTYVHIYALSPDGVPSTAELSKQWRLFPQLAKAEMLSPQPMESMHWHRPWAPWI